MDTKKVKQALCVVPGIGTPVSIYYFVTSKDLRSAAIKGLLLLPASVVVLALSVAFPIPGAVLLVAGAYLYWGIISLLAGAGFLSLLLAKYFAVRLGEVKAPAVELRKEEIPIGVPAGTD